MTARILGAAKAVAPLLLSAALLLVDAAFGKPLDLDALHTLAAGVLTGVVVYFVPNAQA